MFSVGRLGVCLIVGILLHAFVGRPRMLGGQRHLKKYFVGLEQYDEFIVHERRLLDVE